jgi:hypothetical protein
MHSSTENLSHAITGPESNARTVYARETPVSATPSYRNKGYIKKSITYSSVTVL